MMPVKLFAPLFLLLRCGCPTSPEKHQVEAGSQKRLFAALSASRPYLIRWGRPGTKHVRLYPIHQSQQSGSAGEAEPCCNTCCLYPRGDAENCGRPLSRPKKKKQHPKKAPSTNTNQRDKQPNKHTETREQARMHANTHCHTQIHTRTHRHTSTQTHKYATTHTRTRKHTRKGMENTQTHTHRQTRTHRQTHTHTHTKCSACWGKRISKSWPEGNTHIKCNRSTWLDHVFKGPIAGYSFQSRNRTGRFPQRGRWPSHSLPSAM